jgi:anaerobic selenocysteine-containing dehydrogenase
VPGLGASFGRGAATTYQQDLANSDCILIMGSNMAEAHPVGFRWPMKAREKGATLIHVDPRFTRTSALCDLFVGIRAGTDIAFLGGVINYVLTHERWFKEYVLAYTNASAIIQEGFQDTEDLAGLFSGYDPQTHRYNADNGHWGYQPSSSSPRHDPTLQHPHCVMQILRRHFARYTPEMVASVCGCTPGELVRVAELLCANSGRERTSAIVYAVGWTQHSTGVQIIRTAGILQLLLGNVGRPGGGIMAMRGHSSIQGSTDVPTLYDLLPGYLPQPTADGRHNELSSYVEHEGLPTGYWANFRKFIVSLLKAWYGDAATADNDYRFAWPANRRIMYNRASADPEGRPWSERKKLIWWDQEKRRWAGDDVPDFDAEKPPDYRPPPGATGMEALAGTAPFIMKPDGVGWLYAPGTLKDGPLPTHYEPIESPVGNLLYPQHPSNPAARVFQGPLNQVADVPTPEYPVAATTFRLTEHYLSGPMSRFNCWLNELQPEMFVELSPELAAERAIEPGGWVTVRTPRGAIEARAMVTRRLQPFLIHGRIVHQIGLPIHWGFAGESVGATANDVTALVGEPNVSIHEAKAFACQVQAGRLGGPTLRPTVPPALWPTREPIPDTPAAAQPEGRFENGHE